ncbi:MAG: glutathione S-transferase N-terminal domain-containing protein [Polyangiaceae bacterium]
MSKPELTLVGEYFSPFTEKALWALDHHGIPHRYDEYTPLLGEPWLRLRAGRWKGRVSVPWLLGPDLSFGDSVAIARHADAIGAGEPLFPAGEDAAIEAWNERAESLMRAGRAQVLERTETSRQVAAESLPAFLPAALRTPLAGSARLGTAYLRRKYGVLPVTDEELEPDLAAIRDAVAAGATRDGPRYLLGRFTFADVAVASALQSVQPHHTHPLGLQPGQREAWTRAALADRWRDVLAWRDEIVERHRAAAAAR